MWTLENHQELLFKTLLFVLYYELQAIYWGILGARGNKLPISQGSLSWNYVFAWVLLLCEHGRCQFGIDYRCNADDAVTM
jgi:hypothetical protein